MDFMNSDSLTKEEGKNLKNLNQDLSQTGQEMLLQDAASAITFLRTPEAVCLLKTEFGRRLMKRSTEIVKGTHWETVLWPKKQDTRESTFTKKFLDSYDDIYHALLKQMTENIPQVPRGKIQIRIPCLAFDNETKEWFYDWNGKWTIWTI